MADWSTEDPVLMSEHGPHETAAVMRMHRAGWPGGRIVQALGIKASVLVKALSKSMDEEYRAQTAGRPIHDSIIEIPKEKN